MNAPKTIQITQSDHGKLTSLLRSHTPSHASDKACRQALMDELNRASITSADEIPTNVITLHSRVQVNDRMTGETLEITIVMPDEADVDAGKISVLAPLGTALLGFSEGDEIEWQVPAGVRHLCVQRVLFQPEAAGAEG